MIILDPINIEWWLFAFKVHIEMNIWMAALFFGVIGVVLSRIFWPIIDTLMGMAGGGGGGNL